MLKRTILTPLALAAAALVLAAPAQAQRQDDLVTFGQQFQRGDGLPSSQWDTPRRERSPEQREVPLSQILRDLKGKYGGQHLDARRQGEYYMISWMTEDGRRLTLRVSVATGREQ